LDLSRVYGLMDNLREVMEVAGLHASASHSVGDGVCTGNAGWLLLNEFDGQPSTVCVTE